MEGDAAKGKVGTPPVDRKAPTALYVANAESEQGARDLMAEEDRDKIKSIVRLGSKFFNWKVQFDNHDIAQGALFRAQGEIQKHKGAGGRMPKIVFFEEKPSTFHQRDNHSQGGAGTWQGSNRGHQARPTSRRPVADIRVVVQAIAKVDGDVVASEVVVDVEAVAMSEAGVEAVVEVEVASRVSPETDRQKEKARTSRDLTASQPRSLGRVEADMHSAPR